MLRIAKKYCEEYGYNDYTLSNKYVFALFADKTNADGSIAKLVEENLNLFIEDLPVNNLNNAGI